MVTALMKFGSAAEPRGAETLYSVVGAKSEVTTRNIVLLLDEP